MRLWPVLRQKIVTCFCRDDQCMVFFLLCCGCCCNHFKCCFALIAVFVSLSVVGMSTCSCIDPPLVRGSVSSLPWTPQWAGIYCSVTWCLLQREVRSVYNSLSSFSFPNCRACRTDKAYEKKQCFGWILWCSQCGQTGFTSLKGNCLSSVVGGVAAGSKGDTFVTSSWIHDKGSSATIFNSLLS